MNDTIAERLAPTARVALVSSLGGLGLVHLLFGEAITRLFPVWPAGLPGRPYWAHAAGALLLVFAIMILLRKRERAAAASIGVVILLSVIFLHLPRSVRSGNFGDEWLNFFKWLAMASGAFLLAAESPPAGAGVVLDRLIALFAPAARWLLGAFMIGAAVLHIRYAQFVATFIPEWMPWRLFWTRFTAACLAAGGLGLMIPRTMRLAALLTSLMIFLWVPLVHIPHTIADPLHGVGWSECCEALGFAAMAMILARRAPRTAMV